MKKLLWLSIFLVQLVSTHAQTATTIGSGLWSVGSNWSTGVPPTAGSTTSIVIANGFTINFDAASTGISIDQVTIQNGGTLIIDAGTTANLGSASGDDINVAVGGELTVNGTINLGSGLGGANNRLRVRGTLNNNGTFSNSTSTKFIFESGSFYNHQFDGLSANVIPSANYDNNSTLTISGYSSGGSFSPSGLNQSFGNFIWNTPSMDWFADLAGLTTVNGYFQVDDTGAGGFYINQLGSSPNLAVGGDFIVNGGVFGFIGSTSTNGNLTILGNFLMTGGFFQVAEDVDATVTISGNLDLRGGTIELASGGATSDIDLEGDYSFSGGDFITSSGVGNINFVNTVDSQNFTSTNSPTGPINFTVGSLSKLNVSGSNFIDGGSSGTLDLAGTLMLGSTDPSGALQNGTTAGNVRIPTANRMYQTGSTISYNGSSAQFIGNGYPSGGGDVNLTINNSSGVSLSTNLSIVALRTLNLASGNLSIGTQTLTINGTVTGSGGIVGGALSKMVIGGTGNFGTLTFAGTNQLLNFTLNRTSSGLITLGGDLTILGTFTQTDGDLALNGHDLTISGDFSRTSGNIILHSSSTLTVNGSGTMPSSVGLSGTSLNTLEINRASSNFNTTASFTVTNLHMFSGAFGNTTGFQIASGGLITKQQGTMSMSPGGSNVYNVLYDVSGTINSGNELHSNTSRVQDVEMDGGGTVNLSGNRTINGNLTLTSGDFNIGTRTLTLEGDLIADAGSTFTSGTIIFDGNTTISGNSVPTFGTIHLNSSHTLTLPAGDFDVAGDITFEAGSTLNAGTSTLSLSGGNLQTISGGGATLTNITVNKTGGADVDLTSQLNLTGILEISSANSDFDSNGNLVLVSTSDGTSGNASIGQLLNGATVSGDVEVQRFMSSEGRIYRYIASPVSGFSVADLQSDFPITGGFTGSSSCTGCTTNPSMYSYNASTQAYEAFPVSSNSETLSIGVGYSAFIRQDVIGAPVTIHWTGTVNQGQQTLPTAYNGTATSYCLVGNPYPATIDWDNSGWTKTRIAGSISVRDNATGIFQTWNGSTGGLTGGRIAKGQAFWVRTTGSSPLLRVTETVKSSTTGTFFREKEEELDQFILSLSDGVVEDKAYYWVSGDAFRGLDDLDAPKQNNFRNTGNVPLMDLGTYSYGEEPIPMAINSVSSIECSDVIRIYTNDLIEGNYTLKFAPSGSVANLNWILTDNYLGNTVNFSQNPEYSFVVNADAGSKSVDRFTLTANVQSASISNHGNTLVSNYEADNQWYFEGTPIPGATGQEYNADQSGLYSLVTTINGACTSYDEIQFVVTDNEVAIEDVVQLYPNPVKNKLLVEVKSSSPVSGDVYNAMGVLVEGQTFKGEGSTKSAEYDLSGVPAGLYILKLNLDGSLVQRKIIKTN